MAPETDDDGNQGSDLGGDDVDSGEMAEEATP